jgi:hypothetical protein
MSARPSGALAPDVLIVPQHVARNPVARSVARQRMLQAARAFAIRVYLLADGERAEADGLAAARTIYLGYLLAHMRGAADSADARVMHGAISALQSLALRRWAWRTLDAPAIDAGLQRAIAEAAQAPAEDMRRAWADLEAQEHQAWAATRRPADHQGHPA